MSWSFVWSLPLRYSGRSFVRISHLYHARYMYRQYKSVTHLVPQKIPADPSLRKQNCTDINARCNATIFSSWRGIIAWESSTGISIVTFQRPPAAKGRVSVINVLCVLSPEVAGDIWRHSQIKHEGTDIYCKLANKANASWSQEAKTSGNSRTFVYNTSVNSLWSHQAAEGNSSILNS
jgi:hypothetical protein